MAKDEPTFLERLTGIQRVEEKKKKEEKLKEAEPEVIEDEVEEVESVEVEEDAEEQQLEVEELDDNEVDDETEEGDDQEGQLAIDVYQTEDAIIIKSTIAGVKAEDLDISVANDMVTVKGTRRKDNTINEENYFYQECYWGSFTRSVILPVEVKADEADAKVKDGILEITLPKVDKAVAQKIKVTAG